MTRFFRTTTLVVMATSSVLALSACGNSGGGSGSEGSSGSGGSQDGQGKTLTVWIMEGTNPDASPYFAEVSKQFKAKTGADLKVEYVPWASAHDKFTNAFAGGTGPDVAEVGTTWTPEFADAGGLMNVSEKMQKDGMTNRFLPSVTEAGTLDGAVYGVPWFAGVRSLMYRKDMLADAGVKPPTTWAELKSASKAVKEKKKGVIPFPVPAAAHTTTPFIWGAGGEIATKNGDTWTSALGSPESVAGLTFLKSMVDEGYSTPAASTWNEADVRDAFAKGDAAMMISGSWTPASILEAAPELKDKIGVVPIPGKDGGMAPSFAGGSHLSIFETTKNEDLAWTFVQMMTTGDLAQKWAEQSGYFPVETQRLATLEQSDDPLVAPFAKQMKDGSKTLPVTPKWGQAEGAKIIPAMMESMLSGKATPQQAGDQAADEMNKIFGS